MHEAVEGDLRDMPAEDIDRIVERAQRRINEWNSQHGHGRRGSVDPFLAEDHHRAILLRDLVYTVRYLRAALSRAEAEREEARLLVTEANNSLYGSQGYFHSLNGGPFDKCHLANGIENLKSLGRAWCAALKLAAERLDVAASRVDRADTEFGFRVWAQEARDALSLSRASHMEESK